MHSDRSESQQKLTFKDGKLSMSATPSLPASPAAPPPKRTDGKRLRQEELASARMEFGSVMEEKYGARLSKFVNPKKRRFSVTLLLTAMRLKKVPSVMTVMRQTLSVKNKNMYNLTWSPKL